MKLLDRYMGSHLWPTLIERELKVARMQQLNDPFEFTCQSSRDLREDEVLRLINSHVANLPDAMQSEARQYMIENKEDLAALAIERMHHNIPILQKGFDIALRMLCFSRVENGKSDLEIIEKETLMWAHYSSGSKGARIRFDFSFLEGLGDLRVIEYIHEPPSIDPAVLLFPDYNPKYLPTLLDLVSKKSIHWKYEAECRALVNKSHVHSRDIEPGIPFEFINFPIEAVKRVDFGFRYDQSDRDSLVSRLRDTGGSHIEFYQARPGAREYGYRYDVL